VTSFVRIGAAIGADLWHDGRSDLVVWTSPLGEVGGHVVEAVR
jgi:hypothetical protein